MTTGVIGARWVAGALILPTVFGVFATPSGAEPRQVFGYAGVLGEWELVASVTEKAASQSRDFSGPLTMTHVGLCTADGPEERKGEIRMRVSNTRMRATILVDGVACSYRGQLSEFYTGTMDCPDRPAVPLKIWLK
jgi:hypothetical protein